MLIQCWCIVIIDDSFDDFDNFDVANKKKSNNIRVILIKSSQLDEEVLDTITKQLWVQIVEADTSYVENS